MGLTLDLTLFDSLILIRKKDIERKHLSNLKWHKKNLFKTPTHFAIINLPKWFIILEFKDINKYFIIVIIL